MTIGEKIIHELAATKTGMTIQELASRLGILESHARVQLSNLGKKGVIHSEPVRWKLGE